MSHVNKVQIARVLCRAMVCGSLIWGLASCGMSGPSPSPSMVENTIPSPREVLESVGKMPPALELKPMVEFEPTVATLEEFPYESKLFSLSVRDMPLEDVLLALAQEANLNLIIDRGVSRDELVSIEFSNIPLQVALGKLMEVYDYYYTIEKGVLKIEAFEERVFHVNYPLVVTKPESTTGGDVLGSSGSSGSSGSGGGSGDSETIAAASSGISGEFTVSTTIEDEDKLDIWKQIEEALEPGKTGERGLLSPDGMVRINRMGSTIIVKDHPSNILSVASFLQNIEEALKRQVIIEAKIVEVVLDKSHQFGINWDHLRLPFNTTGTSINSSVNLGDLASTGLSMRFVDLFGEDIGTIVLHALASNGEVNILSSPRLNVINNQSAFINVGRVVPFLDFKVGQSTQQTTTGDTTTIDSVPVISRFNEGVTLGITPQIDENGSTVLHIVPIVTEQTGTKSIEVPSSSVTSVIADIPIISVRTTDTVVRVQDQRTIVIGGLISESTDDAISKVPYLGEIPLINWAFSHQERSTQKRELVILLTTTVVML
jgi:MSHA biogenesis protein MshL